MARTKRTIRRMSPPPKRAKSAGGVKFASPSSSPPPHSSSFRPVVGLLPPRPTPDEAMHHAPTPLLDQGIKKSGSAGGGTIGPSWQSQHLPLGHGPVGPRFEERDVANRAALAARHEREGLRLAYFQDSPLRCRHIGATVLLDFVLNFQDQAPTLLALAEEYRCDSPRGGWIIPGPFLL
ncbi:hypothetical protein LIER_30448 [Lithospermum erythrorhizon]|uniref:Uncharacterized protein n=1 Tax=Lithospermum erythrorhizon TaxID=34254 RepID=A0AAV3RN65_LITER